jgi:hypothetical protein
MVIACYKVKIDRYELHGLVYSCTVLSIHHNIPLFYLQPQNLTPVLPDPGVNNDADQMALM